jgi:hypothetical protein
VGFLIALIALLVGSLFQIHIIFAAGCALFVGYAIFAPKAFVDNREDGPK